LVRHIESTKWKWLDVTKPVEEWWREVEAIPELSESQRKLLLGSWLRARETHRRSTWSVTGLLRGALLAGVPALAALYILWRRSLARGPLVIGAAVYFLYLSPYILISHYSRYQMPLAGLQAALVVGAASLFIMRERGRSASRSSSKSYVHPSIVGS
jgi:hypothetical protein